jgi:hypothetical protein
MPRQSLSLPASLPARVPVPAAHVATVRLVTIVASSELWDRIESDLRRLGAGGYTFMSPNGRGEHGVRSDGRLVCGNVRVEAIVSVDVADAIFEHIVAKYSGDQLTAYAQDVDTIVRR